MTAAGLQAPPPVARLFQFVAFSVYTYTIYYSVFYVNVPPLSRNYAIAGKAKFLTQWNLVSKCQAYLARRCIKMQGKQITWRLIKTQILCPNVRLSFFPVSIVTYDRIDLSQLHFNPVSILLYTI